MGSDSARGARWALMLTLAACEQEKTLSALDRDGDGAYTVGDDIAMLDCDDEDARRSPMIVEDRCPDVMGRRLSPGDACVALAYDGVDNDCDGYDWVDVDGDGVPAVTLGDYEAETGAPWPRARVQPVVDPDGIDCNDFTVKVSPNNAEIYYDGVDGACDVGDDFDADHDGHSRIPEGDDCDDGDGAIWPGNPTDDWYDGVDSDCAGNDDYDQDGDGWAPADGDCADEAGGASVHPGAVDLPYDGIDADCAGDDDWDADGDGWPLGADCDDVNTEVHPGGFESLGDAIDGDCDGLADGSPFATHGLGWDEPHSVHVGQVDDYYTLTTSAEYFDDLAKGTTRAGVTLYFDRMDAVNSGTVDPEPLVPTPWWPASVIGASNPEIGAGVAATTSADSLYTAISVNYTKPGSADKGYMVVRRGTFAGGTPTFSTAQSTGSEKVTGPFADIDLRIFDGYVWEWACGADTAGLLVTKDSSTSKLLNYGDATLGGTGVDADTAVFLPGTAGTGRGTGLCCDNGVCSAFAVSDSAGTARIVASGASTAAILAENSADDWTASVTSDGVELTSSDGTTWDVLDGTTVLDAAVAVDGAAFFVLAATDAGLVLAYGTDPLALTEVTMPFTDGIDTWYADKVGIYADADRVILAASSRDGDVHTDTTATPIGAADGDDHVGWVFLGRAF